MVEERKKELGVDMLKYSAAFMLQFSEVRLDLSMAIAHLFKHIVSSRLRQMHPLTSMLATRNCIC